jgi:pimeloyl-[acyl-carrier protein] methyl ester esterase
MLLPGLDGTGRRLGSFVRSLGADVDVRIVPYPLDQPQGYDELEPLVTAALPREQPFVLMGESFSGPLALRIAARSPEGLVGLVLCGTFATNPFPWLAWVRPLAAYLPVKSLPRWLRAVLMWGSFSPQRAPPQSERAIAGVAPAVIRRRIAALLAADETAARGRVLVPTLVLRARRDRVISNAATRCLLDVIPGATVVQIDGPHLLLQACPAPSAAAVLEFLRSASLRRAAPR